LKAALAGAFALLATLPAFALDIQEVTSPKGIKAWLVEEDSVPLISVRFSFKGGSAQDPAGKEGLANLMTGLFDEGAGDMPSDAY
ncbi:insulinase family protein, partial [Ochrobactrum sp. SFR4]|nr:insulinase family protein [Ochrobactrum sp. SFR4]